MGKLGEVLLRIVLPILAGLFFLSIVLINLPGMTILFVILEALDIHLVVSQTWTFSIIISVILYVVLSFMYREPAFLIYGSMSLISAAVFLIAKFGFLAEFPMRFLKLYFGNFFS
jgi:hypothetical protein